VLLIMDPDHAWMRGLGIRRTWFVQNAVTVWQLRFSWWLVFIASSGCSTVSRRKDATKKDEVPLKFRYYFY